VNFEWELSVVYQWVLTLRILRERKRERERESERERERER
jgi:hypothetical protein